MKNVFRGLHFTVFSKILLGFLMAVAVLYLFNIQVNIWGQNEIKKEIVESYQARASFYLASLESEFSSILKAQTKMIVDADLLELTSFIKTGAIDDYPYFREVNAVRNQLVEIRETSSMVNSVCVYLPAAGLKISDRMVTDMRKEDFGMLKAVMVERVLPFRKMEDGYYITITSSDSYLSGDNASIDFAVCVRLSLDEVEGMLNTLSADSHSRAILVGGPHGLDVTQKSGEELTEYFKGYLEKQGVGEGQAFVDYARVSHGKYIFTYCHSQFLDSALIVYEPVENIMHTLTRHRYWLWFLTLLTIVLIFGFSLWVREMIAHPLNKLLAAFKKVGEGTLDIAVSYQRSDEFSFLYDRFNEMFQKLRLLVEEVYEQKIYMKEAELRQLQYQINPHFLYNSILIISNLIRMDDLECAQKLT